MVKDRDEPSKNQLRGLSYVAGKPKFLQNIAGALAGQPASRRPELPTRDDQPERDDSDEDGLDFGEDGPSVVVLDDRKHRGLSKEEALAARKEGALTPAQAREAAPTASRKEPRAGTLNFASSNDGEPPKRRKIYPAIVTNDDEGDEASWQDMVSRTNTVVERIPEASAKPAVPVVPEAKATVKPAASESSKPSMKKPKKAKPKTPGPLSFDNE
ncbi:hypothetical protein E5Q_01179 [Mixia osmundae IAM 14324]|uniref:DUF4604 domain-containing protein n=1 Tax=Mixia osmundae (strain CBS 9802 / IAM 14324 / JCM 22182 / KY 12970) TaxID=764103 RepID=G7DVB7_MIXOS|nr:hypothetical protein E5Q_01179 [Mixia osmundae IAM 14324]